MEAFNNALNWIALHIGMVPWGYLVASLGLSGLFLPLKKPFERWFEKYHDGIMMFTVLVGGLFIAAVHYILNTPTHTPWIITAQGLILFAMSQPWYRALKPLRSLISDKIAKSKVLDEEVRTALEPVAKPEVTPVAAPVVETETVHAFDS